jgi:hypothetical protein
MQDAVIRQKSLQDILTLSEALSETHFNIRFGVALVAYTKNITTDDPTSTYLIENGYHSDEAVRKFKQHKRFETWLEFGRAHHQHRRKNTKYVTISRRLFSMTPISCMCHVLQSREMTPGLTIFSII